MVFAYYVYRYIRLDKNEPFYIGMGKRRCFNSQGYQLYSNKSIYGRAFSKDRNKSCLGIMAKTDYEIEIIYETNSKSHAEEKEKEFIKLYGSIYDGSGSLVNLTEGGISFKPTKKLLQDNVKACAIAGKPFRFAKPLYMYDLDGNFLEKFESLNGFYKKYKEGKPGGGGISRSISKRVSYRGHFFSFAYFDKLDVSVYKKTYSRNYIGCEDSACNIVNMWDSLAAASRYFGVSETTIRNYVRGKKPFRGFFLKNIFIKRLNKANAIC